MASRYHYPHETNPLNGAHPKLQRKVGWDDPKLAMFLRVRFLSEPGFPFWDLSYAYGILVDGTNVHVDLGFSQVPKGDQHQSFIISAAKNDRVNLHRLKFWEALSKLW